MLLNFLISGKNLRSSKKPTIVAITLFSSLSLKILFLLLMLSGRNCTTLEQNEESHVKHSFVNSKCVHTICIYFFKAYLI